MNRRLLPGLVAVLVCVGSPVSGLVVTEIMYNPPGASEDLEFIELYNEKAAPEDLSGYKFVSGIRFVFPTGFQANGRPISSLGSGEYLVLASNAAAFQAHYGFAPFGQYEGRLSNTGERIVLENDAGGPFDPVDPAATAGRLQGPRIIDFTYDDDGRWPSACDGTGHSLCLIDPFGSQGDPSNWAPSLRMWGTPGAPNGLEDQWIETEFFAAGAQWRYLKGTAEPPASWKDRTFNDTAWSVGASPIGYGHPSVVTVLSDMRYNYRSFYTRRSFSVADPAQVDRLVLYVNWDDGFVAYLNGQEVARANITGTPPAYNATASSATNPAGLAPFDISGFKGLLVPGTNVIAIQTHNERTSSNDAFMDARLVSRTLSVAAGGDGALVINEVFFLADSGRFVELYNRSAAPVSLNGLYLSNDASNLTALPLAGHIAGHGYLAMSQSPQLPLEAERSGGSGVRRVKVFLTYVDPSDADNRTVVAARTLKDDMAAGWSIGRVPDGSSTWHRMSVPNPGAANTPSPGDVSTDVVINEIMYHPFREDNPYTALDDALYGDNLEYVELYNRGTVPADISGWRFTSGIQYEFPQGAVIPPDGYLVLAKNPERIKQIYGIDAFGPYTGVLSNRGERLRIRCAYNNVANEVTYHDSGRWSKWADGLGSSLELIDPRQYNDFAGAWAASDESGKSEWTTVSYSGTHAEFWTSDSEFHMHLMGRGEMLIDELQMSTDPSMSNSLVRGGGFNQASDFTSNWIRSGDTGGNHIDSHWTSADAFSGAGCLKLVASGRGDTGFNRLESDTTAALTRRQYFVRYHARWLRGNNILMTRTHGHGMARASAIPVPENLGTPGARNSVYRPNLGPVYADLAQNPVVPNANEPVTVTVRIADSDGVASAVIRYRRDTTTTYSQAVMNDSGTGADAQAGDGIWTGTIPGQPSGTVMEFYIEAADGTGQTTQYPPLVPPGAPPTVLNDLAIYRVGDRRTVGHRPIYRVTLTRDGEQALNARRSLSNHLVPCSFVLNEKRIIYNCGQRFRGSPFIRRGGVGGYAWSGLRIRFPSDDPLFGFKREINFDSSGHDNQRDRTAYYLMRKVVAAIPGVTGSWSTGRYVDLRYKAGSREHNSLYDVVQKIDGDYLEYWWRGRDDGSLYKVDDWFEFRDDGSFQHQQASMTYRGENKESYYRQNYKLRSRSKDDDFSHLINLMRVITTNTGTTLDGTIGDLMDVRQWSAILSVRLFIDDWDTLGVRRGKNAYVYLPPYNGLPPYQKWQLIPWDSDLTFGNTSAQIYPAGEMPQLQKLFARPWVRRMINSDYLFIMDHAAERIRLNAWLQWVASSVGIGGTENAGWCQSRASFVRAAMTPGNVASALDIFEPAETPHVTDAPTVRIRGRSSYAVERIDLNGFELGPRLTWPSSAVQWEYTAPLAEGENMMVFDAYGRDGEKLGSRTITVISTYQRPPSVTSFTPNSAGVQGGSQIVVNGARFEEGATVKFGEADAEHVQFVSDRELRVTAPPHPVATVIVTVTNPNGLSGSRGPFTFEYVSDDFYIMVDSAQVQASREFTVGVTLDFDRDTSNVNLGDIQGWSYGLCSDGDYVTPVAISVWTDTQSLHSGQGPNFFSARLPHQLVGGNTSGVAVAVVVDYAQQVAVSPTNGWRDVRVTYTANCSGGDCGVQPVSQTEIRPCHRELGMPPTDAVMVINGQGLVMAGYSAGQVVIEGSGGFIRGDANGDRKIDIADAIYLLGHLFTQGPPPQPPESGDANGDGKLDIADAIYILSYLFAEGPPPPPPFPGAG